MKQPIEIDQYRPHINIRTLDGNIHIVPEIVFEKIIYGEMQLEELEDYRVIVVAIIKEWLDGINTQ